MGRIEDIIDTGGTLSWLKEYLANKKCASVRVACLLDKKARRLDSNRSVKLDYMGFHCPDNFVIGYGMDYAGHYRCLPFIGILKPEVYMDK
jgi:hypoxanthine phosphoribosyltransferase